MMQTWARATRLATVLLLLAAATALAQTADPPADPAANLPADPAAPGKLAVPDNRALAVLIQNSVVALSQANRAGNFTVLHALAAPSFQQANPPAKLAQIFAFLREKNIDLTPIILFSPVLTKPASIGPDGRLRATGLYKTAPLQIEFDILFEPVAGQWRLFGLALNAVPAPPADLAPGPAADAAAPAAADAPAEPAAKPAKVKKKSKAKVATPAAPDATAPATPPAQ